VARAIVGLGNPGDRYTLTRHNAGFLAADAIAAKLGVVLEPRGRAVVGGRAAHAGSDVIIIKPQLFMNRSGPVVSTVLETEELSPADMLVVHDEIDLPLGRVKLKRGGGTAGHRGLESIVESLGSTDFPRLRIGVGRPPAGQDAVLHVLEPFADSERETLAEALDLAAAGALLWVSEGIEMAMSRVNVRPPRSDPSPNGDEPNAP
jgi:PTH1 family peptidyl-tRNA hydrolase